MEPELAVPARLHTVLEELREREPLFHRAEPGTTRREFDDMITRDFWEVGASGKRYGRDFILDTLEKRHGEPFEDAWAIRDFHVLEIAENNFLATYTLTQGERVTRRATIWRRTESSWKAVYHQGTLAAE